MSTWSPDTGGGGTAFPAFTARIGTDNNTFPAISLFYHPNGNSIFFPGTPTGTVPSLTAGEWWSIRLRAGPSGNADFRTRGLSKIWKSGSPEPDWMTDLNSNILTDFGPAPLFTIDSKLATFVQDNFYVKYRNLSVRYV